MNFEVYFAHNIVCITYVHNNTHIQLEMASMHNIMYNIGVYYDVVDVHALMCGM